MDAMVAVQLGFLGVPSVPSLWCAVVDGAEAKDESTNVEGKDDEVGHR